MIQSEEPSAFATALMVQQHRDATMKGVQRDDKSQIHGQLSAQMSPAEEEYERQRVQNIRANEQLMNSLGLSGSPSQVGGRQVRCRSSCRTI